MGLDLTLMPLLGPEFWVSHTHIDVHRRSELFDAIMKLQCIGVPKPVTCFRSRPEDPDGETQYGECLEDPYGERLTWTTPSELMEVAEHEGVIDNWINRSVWAYIAHMPPDWPIVLYWH